MRVMGIRRGKCMKKFRKFISQMNDPQYAAYFFLLPSLLVLGVFVFVPLISSFGISLFDINIFLSKIKFVGLENFKRLFLDGRFWNAMKNTLYFTGLQMPLQILTGQLLVAYVSTNTLWRKSIRFILFIPVICSIIAMAIVWSMLLDPTIWMVPYLLSLIGITGSQLLKDPVWAMPSVIFMTVWKNFGITMVILVSGIQSIPDLYFEAA